MASGESGAAVQRAMIAAIKADATLTGLIAGRVVDYPGAGAVYPCATIGDITSTPFDTDTTNGSVLQVTVHAFAAGAAARTKARAIGEALLNLFHRLDNGLAVTGHSVTILRRTFFNVFLDGEGKGAIGQAVVRFRVETQSN